MEAFIDKHPKPKQKPLTYEYVRGLAEGEGCFTFYSGWKRRDGSKYKMPAFVIAMLYRDVELLEMIRDTLGLRNPIYSRKPYVNPKNGYQVRRTAVLVVREFDQLKDIIIPFFYKKLKGHKGRQLNEWLEKIGSDPNISDRYKSLYRLYKWGMYDTYPKFTQKFVD